MKNGNRKHFDVFISYRREKGFGIARTIYAELVFRGYRVFMDTECLAPNSYDKQLLDQIQKAKDVIVILTPGALDIDMRRDPAEDWLRLEIDAAMSAEHRPNILPIRDSKFEWPTDGVLKADGVEHGIDVLKFRKLQSEVFQPTHFSYLIDLLSGFDSRKDFSLRAWPVMKYLRRLKTVVTAGLLVFALAWGAVSQIRGIGKLFGIRHDPIVLIGSGTVSNFLRGQDVEKNDRDVIIIDSPSNLALKLLREAKNSERGHCYVVLMAAQRMDGDFFTKNDLDASRISVVEVKLPATDKLQVVLKPFKAFSAYVPAGESSIGSADLVKILRDFQIRPDTFIYRTSLQSGTFGMYSNEFQKCDFVLGERENVGEFYESDKGDALHMTTDDKVIVLCGAMYRPDDGEYKCKGLEGKLLDVEDSQGHALEKPLYLYFVVSKDNPVIPKAIKAFLHTIGKGDVLDNITTSNLDKGIIYRDY